MPNDTLSQDHMALLDHLKDRVRQMEEQLTQVTAMQAMQSVTVVDSDPREASSDPNDAFDPAMKETAERLGQMACNPNFQVLLSGMPGQLMDTLNTLAITPMLSIDQVHSGLAKVWLETGATVPGSFQPVLSPAVRAFVLKPPAQRQAMVEPLTTYIVEQLIQITQADAQTAPVDMTRVQHAISETSMDPSSIDVNTPEGRETLMLLVAGQSLRQASRVIKQEIDTVLATQVVKGTDQA